MFNNRKYINELKAENEKLKRKKEEYEVENEALKRENYILECTNEYMEDIYDDLKDDMEVKEDSITNLLEANKELSLSNNYLENKIKLLEKVIKQHEENECRLNTELCKYKGMLDKIDNYTRMLEGR